MTRDTVNIYHVTTYTNATVDFSHCNGVGGYFILNGILRRQDNWWQIKLSSLEGKVAFYRFLTLVAIP